VRLTSPLLLSSVQKFPEERILLIQTNRVACILVVWAHHVPGLSVLVRLHGDWNQKDTRFGPSPEQVIVDVKEHIDPQKATDELIRRPPSVILLSTDGSTLFGLTEEPDGKHIDGTFRGQAKRYMRDACHLVLCEGNCGSYTTVLVWTLVRTC
jgi:hypothetical protein